MLATAVIHQQATCDMAMTEPARSEEASESNDLVALICSLLCAVPDLGKVAGSSRHGKAALGAGL